MRHGDKHRVPSQPLAQRDQHIRELRPVHRHPEGGNFDRRAGRPHPHARVLPVARPHPRKLNNIPEAVLRALCRSRRFAHDDKRLGHVPASTQVRKIAVRLVRRALHGFQFVRAEPAECTARGAELPADRRHEGGFG